MEPAFLHHKHSLMVERVELVAVISVLELSVERLTVALVVVAQAAMVVAQAEVITVALEEITQQLEVHILPALAAVLTILGRVKLIPLLQIAIPLAQSPSH